MIHTSKLHPIRVLFAAALAVAGCSGTSGGQIPCVDDASCPIDYPVCGAGKCIAGTSNASTSVAVVGAEGHTAADFLSGTVRVLVTARASSGVQSLKLAVGSTNFSASATPATPPLFAFDVDTTKLPNADASLTATLTAGDGATATASGTLHVDNAKPVISTFTVAGAPSTTITAGKATAISATFSGGVSATITSNAGGSVGIDNGGSVLVSPDVLTSYSLRVTSRSGVSVQSGSTGQPPDVSVSVAQPASFSGNFTVDRTVIDFGDTGNLAFTAPTFPAAFTAVVNDGNGVSQGAISSGGTLSNVAVPSPMAASTTQLTYTLVINNGATIPDTVSIPLIAKVRPKISSFVFQSGGANTATFDPGDPVGLSYAYTGATGGSANVNGKDAPLPGPLSFANIQASTVYTLTVTNSAGTSVPATATATVRPKIYSFAVGATQSTATSTVTISNGDTTNLFASFAGSGASGSAAGTLACTPSCNPTLTSGTSIASGVALGVTGNTNGTNVYTLTVSPSSGAPVTAAATIKVVPLATATSLTAVTSIIHSGGSTTLSPTFDAGISSVAPGSAIIVGVDDFGSTTTYSGIRTGVDVNVAPLVSTTYTLYVTNGAGRAAVTSPSVRVDVAKGTWSALNSNAFDFRRGATVTALDSGKVLIAGGLDGTGNPTTGAYLCDATGNCVSKTMGTARAFHTAVKIAAGTNNHKVLIAGGYSTSATTPLKSAEFFDGNTSAESFANTTDISTSGRSHHIATLLGDGSSVLIAGGNDGSANLPTAIKYDTSTATPTATALTNSMTQARTDFTGTLLGVPPTASSKVLIVGGKVGDTTAELFDPSANTFTATTGALPSGEDKRSLTAVLIGGTSPNIGKVLISGGLTGASPGTASSTQFLYDATSQLFTSTASLLNARGGQAAIFVPTDSVLLCGGTTDGTNPIPSCERYNASLSVGTQGPTAPMLMSRRDFGLAAITISSITEFLAAGGASSVPGPGGAFAETYNPN
jgi:hypothetical protein